MKKYSLVVAIFAVALAIFIIGIQFNGRDSKTNTNSEQSTQTVRGLGGKEITIKSPVSRIVAIPTPAASMIISVDGKTDRLVGMHQASKNALLAGILGEFYPNAKNIASNIAASGFIPNIETILGLNPDVVLQMEWYPKTFTAMENVGLKVASFTSFTSFKTEENVLQTLRLMADILDMEKKQEELIQWRTQIKNVILAKTADIAKKNRPSVLIIFSHQKGLKIFGSGKYWVFYVNMAGGILLPRDMKGFPTVDMEQLLQWDPDILMISNFDPLLPSDVYSDANWASLTAVKNRRVYKVPLGGFYWTPPSQESPLTWMWYYNILHPDKKPFDLRAEIKNTYNKLIYKKELTDAHIDTVLHISKNSQSAHYEQFMQ